MPQSSNDPGSFTTQLRDSAQQRDGVALDLGEAEEAGGFQCLGQKLAGAVGVAGVAAAEEQAGPLRLGAGEKAGGAHAGGLVCSGGEGGVGSVVVVEGGGE